MRRTKTLDHPLPRSGNPVLRASTFDIKRAESDAVMTLEGTINKTGMSVLILMAAAALAWNGQVPSALLMPVIIAAVVVALFTSFNMPAAPITTPIYAALEGMVLGLVSIRVEQRYPGIVLNAVALTFGTLLTLLLAYHSGLMRPTKSFKLLVLAGTGGIAVLYLLEMLMNVFGHSVPFIHESGLLGILFSLVVVTIAALNLVLDFDFIQRGAKVGAPKYMEWYGAFGLLVTLVWLYLEILRLLGKGKSRR